MNVFLKKRSCNVLESHFSNFLSLIESLGLKELYVLLLQFFLQFAFRSGDARAYDDMRKLQADEKEKQMMTQQKLQQAQTPLGRPMQMSLAPPGTAPSSQAVPPPPMPPMAFGMAPMMVGMRPPPGMGSGVTPPPPPPTPPSLWWGLTLPGRLKLRTAVNVFVAFGFRFW